VSNKIESQQVSIQTLEQPKHNDQIKPDKIKDKILSVFNGKPLSIKDIIEQAQLDWTTQKLTSYLKKVDEIDVVKNGRNNFYKRKAPQVQTQLFG